MSENRRPTRITLLGLFILGLALWNGLRLVQAFMFWSILNEYQAEPGPLYVAVSGGFWFLVEVPIFWGLWKGKAWAWFAALGSVAGYASWYWFDRLVLQKPHSNWPVALAISVFLIIFVYLILFSSRARRYFSILSFP